MAKGTLQAWLSRALGREDPGSPGGPGKQQGTSEEGEGPESPRWALPAPGRAGGLEPGTWWPGGGVGWAASSLGRGGSGTWWPGEAEAWDGCSLWPLGLQGSGEVPGETGAIHKPVILMCPSSSRRMLKDGKRTGGRSAAGWLGARWPRGTPRALGRSPAGTCCRQTRSPGPASRPASSARSGLLGSPAFTEAKGPVFSHLGTQGNTGDLGVRT